MSTRASLLPGSICSACLKLPIAWSYCRWRAAVIPAFTRLAAVGPVGCGWGCGCGVVFGGVIWGGCVTGGWYVGRGTFATGFCGLGCMGLPPPPPPPPTEAIGAKGFIGSGLTAGTVLATIVTGAPLSKMLPFGSTTVTGSEPG